MDSDGEIAAGDDPCSSSSLPPSNRQRAVYNLNGTGRGFTADVIVWKRGRVAVGVIIGATVAWLLFERSGLSYLTICSDVLLILIVVQYVRVKMAALLHKSLKSLPELVLSEEMVNNAAASFRVKLNNMLMMAHDITLGKDFRLFFLVVATLWLLSVIGNLLSSLTLTYIGTIALATISALYDKYQEHFDRYAALASQKISKHYKVVDENLISRLPRNFIKDKDE